MFGLNQDIFKSENKNGYKFKRKKVIKMIKSFSLHIFLILLCLFRFFCDIFEINPDNFSERNKQISQLEFQSTNLITFFGNGKPQVEPVLVLNKSILFWRLIGSK